MLLIYLMGISWVQPSNVKDVLVAWRRRPKKGWVHGIWKLIPLSIWWCTWKERNRQIFEGKSLSFQNFKLSFLGLLYIWSHVVNGSLNLTFLDFIDKIMLESSRAWSFCNCPFCKWLSPLWWLFYITHLFTYQKKYFHTFRSSTRLYHLKVIVPV